MGQYYHVCNLDKRQFLQAHAFGQGLKLLEFGSSGDGLMCGLAVLLADGNGRGGGDLHSENPLIGSWAGDRIVVAGDYADPGKYLEHVGRDELMRAAEHYAEGYQQPERVTLYAYAGEFYEDISYKVVEALCDDQYLREALIEGYWTVDTAPAFLKGEVREAIAKRERQRSGEQMTLEQAKAIVRLIDEQPELTEAVLENVH